LDELPSTRYSHVPANELRATMRHLPPLPRNFKGVATVVAVALVACAFFAVFGSRGVMDLRRLQRQQNEAEAVAYSLALKNQKLRDHLDRLEHDDRYLEKIARERLGLIKPGEIVYRANARPARP
jgi:cell division protein FtsB